MNKVYSLDVPSGYPRTPTPQPPSGGVPEFDVMAAVNRILRAVRRRLSLLIAVFLLTFAAVAVYTFQLQKVYTATSSVIVKTRDQKIVDLGAMLNGLPADTAFVDTEVQILQSRVLIEKVVRRLDLVNTPEFNFRLRKPTGLNAKMGELKAFMKSLLPGKKEPAPAPEAAVDPADKAAELDAVIGAVQGSININRLGATYVIQISARSTNPKLAADISNAVAAVYLDNQLDTKMAATKRANEWLSRQITQLREELNTASAKVEQFRASRGLQSTATGGTLTEQSIAQLNASIADLESQLEDRRSRLRNVTAQIAAGSGADAIAEVLNSPTIGAARTAQLAALSKLADLERTKGPRNPEVLRAQAEVENINRQIDAEVRRVHASLQGEVTIMNDRLNSLKRSLGAQRGQLSANSVSQIQLSALEQEAEASRQLLTRFLDRNKETAEMSDMLEADAVINGAATVPGWPSFPNTNLNLVMGFMLGLALAALVALVAELMDNYLSTPEEVEQTTGVPYIGQVPLLPATGNFAKARIKPAEYLIEKPHSGFAEAFRNLRASIMFADIDKAAKTVAVVSSLPDEGKTSMTYCLGRMAAMSGTKTIIIDGDVRRRQLTEISGLNPEVGLLEYLFGEARLAETIVTDEKTGLHILPLTDRKHTPRDVFGSRAFDALLNLLQQSYDLIVIDTGPVLLMAETRVVTSKVDQVVVAARWRKTNRHTVRETIKVLREFNANIAGVVLTFVDLRKRAHAYSATDYKAYSKYYQMD